MLSKEKTENVYFLGILSLIGCTFEPMGCDWEYGENSEIYPSIKIFKFEIEQLDLEA